MDTDVRGRTKGGWTAGASRWWVVGTTGRWEERRSLVVFQVARASIMDARDTSDK